MQVNQLVKTSQALKTFCHHATRASRLGPINLAGRFRRQRMAQKLDRTLDAFVSVEQSIFVLNAHHVVIADFTERSGNAAPSLQAMPPAHCPEIPGSLRHFLVGPPVKASVRSGIPAVNRAVLGVHVEDPLPEFANGHGRIDAQPKQMAWIKVHSEIVPRRFTKLERRLGVVDEKARMHLDREPDSMCLRKGRSARPIGDRYFVPLPLP